LFLWDIRAGWEVAPASHHAAAPPFGDVDRVDDRSILVEGTFELAAELPDVPPAHLTVKVPVSTPLGILGASARDVVIPRLTARRTVASKELVAMWNNLLPALGSVSAAGRNGVADAVGRSGS